VRTSDCTGAAARPAGAVLAIRHRWWQPTGCGEVDISGAVWLYLNGHTVWPVVLLGWTIGTGSLDNGLRPALIRRGADLPFVLSFAGVLGGMLAFGLIGL
jgi:predicted PurR-regulated permease PerM